MIPSATARAPWSLRRWDRAQIDRSELDASTDITTQYHRCRAWSVSPMLDCVMDSSDRATVFMDAVDALGCYCVARPGEVTP